VQLDLPAVDEDLNAEPEQTPDVPVLYPEVEAEVPAAETRSGQDVPEESEAPREIKHVEEKLVVSEWPDPSKPTIVASLESEQEDDKDASANG
jgi:hypothetical protein